MMKIFIERKYFKDGYTIGRLYVDGKYLCHTLEPIDRGVENGAKVGDTRCQEWKTASNMVLALKTKNPRGTTAIPRGQYEAVMSMSQKFKARRLFLKDVPGFTGIMIHEGNTKKDTQGCILVGWNTQVGKVLESRKALGELNELALKALGRGERIIVQVTAV